MTSTLPDASPPDAAERPVPALRAMTPAELALAVDWAAAEGWNPGLADAACFLAADPEGFRIAFVDGAPAAVVSAVSYGPGFGFVGFYIAAPAFRGRGVAKRLWDEALGRLTCATVGLDAVVQERGTYERAGFRALYRHVRLGGVPQTAASGAGPELRPLGPADAGRLAALDTACFGAPRPAFLAGWLGAAGHVALGREGSGGAIRGYGVLRPCREGSKIGPLFAEDAETAAALLDTLLARAGEGPVFIDVPDANPAGVELARARGLAPVFETWRMYRGPALDLPTGRIWGATSLELG